MSNPDSINCDILVIGAGFGGSLLALCLRQAGFDVCVVERGSHPRFAIGESSTPIADMILRRLASRYNLPWLAPFSRYGSWQDHHPEIGCGLKRGFSYFRHEAGEQFKTDANHSNELLVAASVSDEQSDTHWLRADFDAFLVEKLRDYEIRYLDETEITEVNKNDRWSLTAASGTKKSSIEADFLVDATGSSQFLNRHLEIPSTSDGFITRSRAIYSHFEGVARWESQLEALGISTNDFPYDADHSALHHLLDGAWMWMLRFNNNRCSTGFLLDIDKHPLSDEKEPAETWEALMGHYPSLNKLFRNARLSKEPGKILGTPRLQRRLVQATGPGWVALPHTAGFVDPMHSTGIAHTLSGVERLTELLASHFEDKKKLETRLATYSQSLYEELKLIDVLVAGSYLSINDFELFSTYVMLYFISAIRYEQLRLKGKIPNEFLCAGNNEIKEVVFKSYEELKHLVEDPPSTKNKENFKENVKRRIKSYDTAGLLDPSSRNMYHHTAVDIESMDMN